MHVVTIQAQKPKLGYNTPLSTTVESNLEELQTRK